MTKTVLELFADAQAAQHAVAGLQTLGVDRDAVTVVQTADDAILVLMLSIADMPAADLQRYTQAVARGNTLVVVVCPDDKVSQVVRLISASPLV